MRYDRGWLWAGFGLRVLLLLASAALLIANWEAVLWECLRP
jgi:hypothetical protein